jgi:methionine-rich copper-binding protein CopC
MARGARRLAALALVVAGVSGGLAAPAALAHVQIVKTNPSGTAKTSQRSVAVLFSGPIRSGTLRVYGPDGSKVSKGSGGRDPRNVDRLLVGLKDGLKPGKYTAKAKWTSADGHHQEATFGFHLKR